jgi:hypothetical protein
MLNQAVFYLTFSAVLAANLYVLTQKTPLYLPSNGLAALRALEAKKYDSVTLAVEPFRGVMLAANFLGDTRLHIVQESYFPRAEYKPDSIGDNAPLLAAADSCFARAAVTSKALNSALVLISKARPLDEGPFLFSARDGSMCDRMKLEADAGLYNAEDWGAWSQGKRTVLSIPVRIPYPDGGTLVLDVRPVINPNRAGDERVEDFTLDGASQRYRFTSPKPELLSMPFGPKDPGSVLQLVIDHSSTTKFSDIAAGSRDTREVALGLVSARLVRNDARSAMSVSRP